MEDNSNKKCSLDRLEDGQVVEIRLKDAEGSYWTYLRSVAGGVTVWVPELNKVPVEMPAGAAVELSVTLNSSEMLLASGKVLRTGLDGRKPYAELLLDPSCVSVGHQRRYLRVGAIVPVTLRRLPDGITPWGDPVKARTTSLSQGGMSAEADADFSKGEQLAVELELPGGRAQANAIVLEFSREPGKPGKFAARFTHISDTSEAEITKLIYQYQRTHGASRDE